MALQPIRPSEQTPIACTTTGIELVEKQAVLPTEENRSYLKSKVEFCQRFPSVVIGTRNKTQYDINLKQVALTDLIRADELIRDFLWYYKAEVTFDIRTNPPRPYLTKSSTDPNRRHSLNPFPERGKGIYRRPDIIIVKNKAVRWPALAGTDSNGVMHPDNLVRLVEVKFPGDILTDDQRMSYLTIVGYEEELFTILEVRDCRDKEQKERDLVKNLELNALEKKEKYQLANKPPPIYSDKPFPPGEPVRNQPWMFEPGVVPNLLDGIPANDDNMLDILQQKLAASSHWLFEKGDWVYHQFQQVWQYQQTSWSMSQLRQAWQQISQLTDTSLEALKEVHWAHVLLDGAKVLGFVVVVVGVAAGVVTLAVPETLLGALMVILRLLMQFGRVFENLLIADSAIAF